MLERLWARPDDCARVPANVRASVERLRHELRPELGPVDWRPVRERRQRAESRIDAMETYARRSSCRRRALVGYFGESLERCNGCDRCARPVTRRAVPPEIFQRLSRLRRALAGRQGPWGGCLLEPEVLLHLASHPPGSAAALADVPGVGAALAERYGGTILAALGVEPAEDAAGSDSPLWSALVAWRDGVTKDMGVPAYAVIPDRVLRALAKVDVSVADPLRQVHALGPRAREKFGTELLRLLKSARCDRL
jgi:superfamily II DNA helicase RecQ